MNTLAMTIKYFLTITIELTVLFIGISALVMLSPCSRCDHRSIASQAVPCLLTNQDEQGCDRFLG